MNKDAYSANELAAMALSGWPRAGKNVAAKLERLGVVGRQRVGRGGGTEYPVTCLPDDMRIEIAARQSGATYPAAQPTLPGITTAPQQLVADARAGIVQQIELMQARSGYSLDKSCAVLLDMARTGQASPQLVAMLKHARDTRGKKSLHDDGLPSVRSLRRFVERRESGSLVPAVRERDMSVPAWAPFFLGCYQTPQKPSVSAAYCQFAVEYTLGPVPSIHAVRRWLDKVGAVSLQTGRMGSRALKNLKGFVKRDFADLLPGDIYTADGHQFDAEVQHPVHGQAWRPEVTSVVDVATRRAVGFSVALAESGFAVLDALRAAVLGSGVPAILYVDNGSGYVNHMMTDAAVGLMGRLGIQMHHSIPYNSQARGVIERLHKTLWVTAAKRFGTYMGADMDAQARQSMFKITRADIARAGTLTKNPLMPFWDFVAFCNAEIAAYNDRPHRSLPRIADPLTGQRRHQTPNEAWAAHVAAGWAQVTVNDDDATPLFRPRILRAVRRCWIKLFGNDYYSAALEEHHGETLPVGYDIHDPSQVWVYDDAGRLICTAGLDENKRPYMPQSVVERARDQRADAREQRILNQLGEVRAERTGRPAIEHQSDVTIPGLFGGAMSRGQLAERAAVLRAADAEPVAAQPAAIDAATTNSAWSRPATAPARRAEWTRLNEMSPEQRAALGEHAVNWHAMYPSSAEYRAGNRKTA